MGKMGPVPPGCRPKWPHAALLVTHLDQPNHTPRALPGAIWDGNAAIWQVLTGPKEVPVKYNHLGIPTTSNFEGEIDLPHLKITVSDHENNPFGIQWQRYWENAPYPDLVKTVPHVAFEVDDLSAALAGHKVIIQPNSPSEGLLVAFVEVNGAPVELMQYVDKPNDNS